MGNRGALADTAYSMGQIAYLMGQKPRYLDKTSNLYYFELYA